MKTLYLAVAASMTLAAVTPAQANTISLNFAGLNGDAEELVNDYYNGGTGSLGSSGGTNYGISFNNALSCSVQPGGTCNSADLPTGGNLVFFLSGSASTMNVAAGFDTGFSFYYSAAFNPAFVNVYSGLNGTGTLLATLNLPATGDGSSNPACFSTNFCPYTAVGVTFAGIAQSVDFGGSANQVAFADITLGSAVAGGVPEPASWALMLGGFGMVGGAMRSRRKAAVTFA